MSIRFVVSCSFGFFTSLSLHSFVLTNISSILLWKFVCSTQWQSFLVSLPKLFWWLLFQEDMGSDLLVIFLQCYAYLAVASLQVPLCLYIQRLLLCQYQYAYPAVASLPVPVFLSSGCFFASFLLLFTNYIADVWLFQLGATLIIFILYSRFLAKFILHLCSNTFVCTLPSWEICWCSLSCSWWSDPWLAFLNFGFPPYYCLSVYSLIRGSFRRVFLSGFWLHCAFL